MAAHLPGCPGGHSLTYLQAVAAAALTSGGGEEESSFYTAKRQTSAFVFERLLPRTRSHKAAMLSPPATLLSMDAEHFSFDHGRA